MEHAQSMSRYYDVIGYLSSDNDVMTTSTLCESHDGNQPKVTSALYSG